MDYSFQILSVSSPYMDAIVQSLSSTPPNHLRTPPPSPVLEILTVMYLFLKAVMHYIQLSNFVIFRLEEVTKPKPLWHLNDKSQDPIF